MKVLSKEEIGSTIYYDIELEYGDRVISITKTEMYSEEVGEVGTEFEIIDEVNDKEEKEILDWLEQEGV